MYPGCVPDHARRCQAVPGSSRQSRQAEGADAFRCISMHIARWAPAAAHLVRTSFPHGSRQDRLAPSGLRDCQSQKARSPGWEPSTHPDLPRNPCISPRERQLGLSQRHYAEATKPPPGVPPWPASHSLCPPTACCLSRSRKLPLPASVRT